MDPEYRERRLRILADVVMYSIICFVVGGIVIFLIATVGRIGAQQADANRERTVQCERKGGITVEGRCVRPIED